MVLGIKPKCSQCRVPIPKGTSLVKQIKMRNGRWVKVCRRCYDAMKPRNDIRNMRRGGPHDLG